MLGDVRLNYIVTDTLRINIDGVLEKQVRVVVDSNNVDLEENHWITSPIALQPNFVTLHGPASVVGQASDTLTINLPDREIDETLRIHGATPLYQYYGAGGSARSADIL